MLNISPFTYGLKITQIYESGTVFAPESVSFSIVTVMPHFESPPFELIELIVCFFTASTRIEFWTSPPKT